MINKLQLRYEDYFESHLQLKRVIEIVFDLYGANLDGDKSVNKYENDKVSLNAINTWLNNRRGNIMLNISKHYN